MKAPFPYFGGKSKIADAIWSRFGDVKCYVEPFFGSGAVLLNRPDWTPETSAIETVNDADGFICNFWRAVQAEPEQVAKYADWIVSENDLHARHAWLVNQKDSLAAHLEGDPDYYDAKIAGWWCWGMNCWIGSGFCSGNGPWQQVELEDGARKLVHLGNAGQGVNRQLVHLGNAGQGVNRQLVHLGNAGRGVNRQLVHLGSAGRGEAGTGEQGIYAWMEALQERLRRVRVCSGDWSRVCGPTVTFKHGLTAVYLDPPYSAEANRNNDLYRVESTTVAHDVRQWCIENGNNPLMRIALSGYAAEHGELDALGWTRLNWSAHGGYGLQGNGRGLANKHEEVIWFSPFCLKVETQKQASLFELEAA